MGVEEIEDFFICLTLTSIEGNMAAVRVHMERDVSVNAIQCGGKPASLTDGNTPVTF